MTRSSHARRSSVDPRRVLWALLLPLVVPTAGLGQDLVGCQLLEGTLQCVPGTTASPQQQIRILEGEIQWDQALEGAVEQGIRALGPLVSPRPRPQRISRLSCCFTSSKNSCLRLGSWRKSPRTTELTMLVWGSFTPRHFMQ